MATQKVKFLNNKGVEEYRDIVSPEQISGFEKAGFKVLENPFATAAPVNPPTIPGVSSQNPVTSTSGIRDEINLTKSKANDFMSNLDNMDNAMSSEYKRIVDAVPYAETEAGKASLSALDNLRKGLGIYSDAENAQIEGAGQAASAQFDPLITEAKEQKRQGEAKSLVSGGERGGFMNTQISGTAALTPVNSNSFVGAGGELERIHSVYDNNISQLKSQQVMAMQLARDAARKAIRTGKKEDLSLATEAWDRANAAHTESINLANEKIKAISNYQDLIKNRKEDMLGEVTKYTSVGLEIPQELQASIDDTYGEGFSKKYSEVLKAQAEGKADIESATKLVDILSKIPEDQKFKIGDATYTGLKQVDPKRGLWVTTETDRGGNVTQVTTRLNPETGKMEILSTLNLGGIGKPAGGNGGGGGGENDDKEIKAFQADAAEAIQDLDKGDLTWGAAFDSLKVKYPQADNDTINAALGGGVPYSPEEGFDFSGAYGRASTP